MTITSPSTSQFFWHVSVVCNIQHFHTFFVQQISKRYIILKHKELDRGRVYSVPLHKTKHARCYVES